MKIINNTGFALNYVVTSSGVTLADAYNGVGGGILASGSVSKNSSDTVTPKGGQLTNPAVYVGRQVRTGGSTVTVSIEET